MNYLDYIRNWINSNFGYKATPLKKYILPQTDSENTSYLITYGRKKNQEPYNVQESEGSDVEIAKTDPSRMFIDEDGIARIDINGNRRRIPESDRTYTVRSNNGDVFTIK